MRTMESVNILLTIIKTFLNILAAFSIKSKRKAIGQNETKLDFGQKKGREKYFSSLKTKIDRLGKFCQLEMKSDSKRELPGGHDG
jgi:hypothetical protein